MCLWRVLHLHCVLLAFCCPLLCSPWSFVALYVVALALCCPSLNVFPWRPLPLPPASPCSCRRRFCTLKSVPLAFRRPSICCPLRCSPGVLSPFVVFPWRIVAFCCVLLAGYRPLLCPLCCAPLARCCRLLCSVGVLLSFVLFPWRFGALCFCPLAAPSPAGSPPPATMAHLPAPRWPCPSQPVLIHADSVLLFYPSMCSLGVPALLTVFCWRLLPFVLFPWRFVALCCVPLAEGLEAVAKLPWNCLGCGRRMCLQGLSSGRASDEY